MSIHKSSLSNFSSSNFTIAAEKGEVGLYTLKKEKKYFQTKYIYGGAVTPNLTFPKRYEHIEEGQALFKAIVSRDGVSTETIGAKLGIPTRRIV
jgi:hypothetical protein